MWDLRFIRVNSNPTNPPPSPSKKNPDPVNKPISVDSYVTIKHDGEDVGFGIVNEIDKAGKKVIVRAFHVEDPKYLPQQLKASQASDDISSYEHASSASFVTFPLADVSPIDASRHYHIQMKLDVFHGMDRIFITLLKHDGSFGPFCHALKDAFFVVNNKDLQKFKEMLVANKEKNGIKDVDLWCKTHWKDVLKFCKRIVPKKEELLARFNKVTGYFEDITDDKTGDPFFREKSKIAVANLRKHIENNCLSDNHHPLHISLGKHPVWGLETYACVRGTNINECFHKHLRRILSHSAASPETYHFLIFEFIYRWNIKASIRSGLIPDEFSNFYSFNLIEEIKALHNELDKVRVAVNPYSFWSDVTKINDNGETIGLRNKVSKEVEENVEISDEEDDNEEEDFMESEPSCKPLKLTNSQIQSALLEGGSMVPVTPVLTKAEKEKFATEIFTFKKRKNTSGISQDQDQRNRGIMLLSLKNGIKIAMNILMILFTGNIRRICLIMEKYFGETKISKLLCYLIKKVTYLFRMNYVKLQQ